MRNKGKNSKLKELVTLCAAGIAGLSIATQTFKTIYDLNEEFSSEIFLQKIYREMESDPRAISIRQEIYSNMSRDNSTNLSYPYEFSSQSINKEWRVN